MGLFGPKIPKEEKKFADAFKKAMKKADGKNIAELKDALGGYPSGWQGYWLCGVYHDFGMCGSAREAATAQKYFQKALDTATGDDKKWMTEFLNWYGKDAGNTDKPISPELNQARRFGIAMCYCHLLGEKFLCSVYEKYGGDGYAINGILWNLGVDWNEMEAFHDFMTVPTFDRNEQIKATNKFVANCDKAADKFSKCVKQKLAGNEPDWDEYFDMYDYLFAVNCLHGGEIMTGEYAEKNGHTEVNLGLQHLIYAIYGGCAPAIHEFARLANASQANYEMMERFYELRRQRESSKEWRSFDKFIVENLEECIAQNDAEAKRIYDAYYAG